MSTAILSAIEIEDEREDVSLTQAYVTATSGAIKSPNTLQRALFPRLLTEDTGLLVPTGPAAGRLEAVVIPSLVQFFGAESKQRLFLICRDGTPLDDYYTRLPGYAHAQAKADGVARILFFDEECESPVYHLYNPDGSHDVSPCADPFDPQIDIVCTTFSRFRDLFFGSGGVHSLPLSYAKESDALFARRDLFYFDEAAGYHSDEFASFLRLVEFLFAEDLDVVVGTTTMSAARIEQLAFLEVVAIPDANEQPERGIQFESTDFDSETDALVSVASARAKNGPTVLVCDTADQAATALAALHADGFERAVLYDSSMPGDERRRVYADLRALDIEGAQTLLVCDGRALEAADLSFRHVITGPSSPDALVRRAGRCNRRGEYPGGAVVIVGSDDLGQVPASPNLSQALYLDALFEMDGTQPFDAGAWIAFIA